MAYKVKRNDTRQTRRARRETIEGQQAVVYYGRPVTEWPRAWML